MLQVVPRWQITVTLSSGVNRQVWIADTFIENVLRKVADMSFDINPLVRVERVTIEVPQATDGGARGSASQVEPSTRAKV
jgi:hypothetical protein